MIEREDWLKCLEEIESRFKTETGIPTDLSVFPITELYTQPESKYRTLHGEVFTPLQLVDSMVLKSDPKPNQFNLDLCAGHGQFSVRILRYLFNRQPFDIAYYLKTFHYFNEINPENVKLLLKIFGKEINILYGDATKLNLIPDDETGKWAPGIWKLVDGKVWKIIHKHQPAQTISNIKEEKVEQLEIPQASGNRIRTAPLF